MHTILEMNSRLSLLLYSSSSREKVKLAQRGKEKVCVVPLIKTFNPLADMTKFRETCGASSLARWERILMSSSDMLQVQLKGPLFIILPLDEIIPCAMYIYSMWT